MMKIIVLAMAFILIVAGIFLYAQHINTLFGIVLLAGGALLLGNTVRRMREK